MSYSVHSFHQKDGIVWAVCRLSVDATLLMGNMSVVANGKTKEGAVVCQLWNMKANTYHYVVTRQSNSLECLYAEKLDVGAIIWQ